jgi:hypothetical protein
MMGDVIEGLARHPSFGVDKVTQITDKLMESSGMGGSDAISGAIGDALNDAVSKPVGESGFGNFTDATVNATDILQGMANGDIKTSSVEKLLNTNADTLLQVKNAMSSELFSQMGLDAETATKIEGLLGTLFETIAETDIPKAETATEAQALASALSVMFKAGYTEGDTLTDVIPEPYSLVDAYLSSRILIQTIRKLTANGERDPLALFVLLNHEDIRGLALKERTAMTNHLGGARVLVQDVPEADVVEGCCLHILVYALLTLFVIIEVVEHIDKAVQEYHGGLYLVDGFECHLPTRLCLVHLTESHHIELLLFGVAFPSHDLVQTACDELGVAFLHLRINV